MFKPFLCLKAVSATLLRSATQNKTFSPDAAGTFATRGSAASASGILAPPAIPSAAVVPTAPRKVLLVVCMISSLVRSPRKSKPAECRKQMLRLGLAVMQELAMAVGTILDWEFFRANTGNSGDGPHFVQESTAPC